MAEDRAGDSPAFRLRVNATAALLRVYMKKESTHSVELEEVVQWFVQNAPHHPQYQEYLSQKRQQYEEYLLRERQPKTLLGKLFRRRSIT